MWNPKLEWINKDLMDCSEEWPTPSLGAVSFDKWTWKPLKGRVHWIPPAASCLEPLSVRLPWVPGEKSSFLWAPPSPLVTLLGWPLRSSLPIFLLSYPKGHLPVPCKRERRTPLASDTNESWWVSLCLPSASLLMPPSSSQVASPGTLSLLPHFFQEERRRGHRSEKTLD